jgi:hypothetical protein
MTTLIDETARTLFETLTGSDALVALLADDESVFDAETVYDNAPFDYVVFSHLSGGPMLINPSPMEANLWLVQAVSIQSAAHAAAIFSEFDKLLNKQKLPIADTVNYWCAREQNIKRAERTSSGQLIWMVAGIYRIDTDH